MMRKRRNHRRSNATILLLAQAALVGIGSSVAHATNYSTLLGAANINATYYLNPNVDVLNDAQAQLDAIGSHTEKLELDQYDLNNTWSSNTSKYAWNTNWPSLNSSTSLTTLAQLPALTKAFSDPDITSYDLTTYSPNIPGGGDGTGYWAKGITSTQEAAETTSFYNLTKYLMQTYNGSGKSFYLSNWEGDGALVDAMPSGDTVPPPTEVQGMIGWLNARQLGIDEARAQFASEYPDVHVYGTIEVNHVQAAMQGDVYNGVSGFATVTNDVLPYTTTDFVSYSSYDTQRNTTGPYSYANAVAYVAAHLPATAINGQNTHSEYVGEFGLAENYSGAATVNSTINNVISTAVADGMPLAFYWEVYSNELDNGVTTPPGGDGQVAGVQGFYFVKPDGTPATAWKTYVSMIVTNDPTQATSAAVERNNLHLAYASNFTVPGAILGTAWTTNTTGNAMSVGIVNGQLQMTTMNASNAPVGQATLNIQGILGQGLPVGGYLQFTLNRQNDAGIIGVSAFGVNNGSEIGSGNQTLDVYPSQAGYGWTPISYNGSNNTNPTYNWDSATTTLGLRLTSADGVYATINYYVNGTYSGSWLYQTSSTSLSTFSLFSQSSTANAGFAFNNLTIYTPSGSLAATNYVWDPSRNGSGSGGSGTWDSGTTADLFNGSADVTWNYATLGDQVSFNGAAGTVTVASAGITASNLIFNSPNYIVAGGTITMLGNQTINASNGTVTIDSPIAGATGLTIVGSGIVALAGTNTFSNGLYVNSGGTAAFAGDANLGAAGQPITLNGGTLQYTGTISPTLTRTINLQGGGGTINLVNNAGTGKLVINGTNLITGSGNITKTGPGWLTLYGSNNVTGNWNVNGGVVEAGGANVLGTGSVTVNSGGELSNTASAAIANPITMNTGGTLGADYNTTSTGVYSGPITANGNFTLRLGNFWSSTSQNVSLTGNITGAGAMTTGFASGATSTTGVLTLSGNNTGYSGNIIVTGGTLVPAVSANNVLGTGAINLSGGKLSLQGQITPSGSAAAISPVSVTGFTIDSIFAASETSKYPSGNNTTNTLMDGAYSFYQNGYTPPSGSQNAGTSLTGGLAGTAITSTTTDALTGSHTPFALQSLTANNTLQINEGSSGTLTLSAPSAYKNLSILADASYGADASPNLTINFNDGTSVTTTYKAYDWSLGTDTTKEAADVFGSTGINRYSPIQSPGWDQRSFGIYETDIDLTDIYGVNYSGRLVTSLTFTADTSNTQGLGKTDVFAISGSAYTLAAGGPYQSYGNNVNITANTDIDVSGSLNAYLGNLSIGNATLTASSVDTSGNPYTLNFQSTAQNGSPTFNVSNSAGGGHGTLNLYASLAGYPDITTPQVFQAFSVINGKVAFAEHAGGAQAIVTVVSSLSITNSSTLDLTNNALVVHNGSLGAITAMVKAGYGIGNWQGTGIVSSSAASDSTRLTTLGILLNTNGSGGPIYSTFDGEPVSATDVLVAYTYYGDADLSGVVDGSDYSRIDNGYLRNLTGWQNGDFNYDGVVNGSDYTLIDNAFNTQGAAITTLVDGNAATATAEIANPSSVPEPAAISLLAVGSVGMLARRRRKV
jgi:hypothetical protein